jgi:hypothetical protein
MKKATCLITGVSPYSQSRRYDAEVEKLERETADAYDKRNWQHHQHCDPATKEVLIPQMALKNAMADIAAYWGHKIAGKGNRTWGKHFKSGIVVQEPIRLGVPYDKTDQVIVYCDSAGNKGSSGGSQVPRAFPIVHEWSGQAEFLVMDETITEDIFHQYLKDAGMLIGFGRWRPQNGGCNGRFTVSNFKWENFSF